MPIRGKIVARKAGGPYKGNWIPDSYKIDDEFNCLTNSENLAKKNRKLRIVRGFTRISGVRDQWGEHQWCVAPNGEIVDPYFDHEFPGKTIHYKEDPSAFGYDESLASRVVDILLEGDLDPAEFLGQHFDSAQSPYLDIAPLHTPYMQRGTAYHVLFIPGRDSKSDRVVIQVTYRRNTDLLKQRPYQMDKAGTTVTIMYDKYWPGEEHPYQTQPFRQIPPGHSCFSEKYDTSSPEMIHRVHHALKGLVTDLKAMPRLNLQDVGDRVKYFADAVRTVPKVGGSGDIQEADEVPPKPSADNPDEMERFVFSAIKNGSLLRLYSLVQHYNGALEVGGSVTRDRGCRYSHERSTTFELNIQWYDYEDEQGNPVSDAVQSEVDDIANKADKQISEWVVDINKTIYKELEKDYDWLMSDENVDDTINANDYTFDEDGTRDDDGGYKFDELTDEAKERARNWWKDGGLDYEWWDSTYDHWKERLNEMGFGDEHADTEINFSGFSSQGDGASFTCSRFDFKKFVEYVAQGKGRDIGIA